MPIRIGGLSWERPPLVIYPLFLITRNRTKLRGLVRVVDRGGEVPLIYMIIIHVSPIDRRVPLALAQLTYLER